MLWMTPSPRGELDTSDDCVCCRDYNSSPCECECDDCGELIESMCACGEEK